MMRKRFDNRKAFWLSAIIIFAIVALYRSCGPTTLIHTSVQPTTVSYDIGDPYQVQAFRKVTEEVELRISRLSEPRYYSIDIDFISPDGSITQTNWREDGVEVVFSTEHRVFIPKRSFIGGR